jgi:hypothetical protein
MTIRNVRWRETGLTKAKSVAEVRQSNGGDDAGAEIMSGVHLPTTYVVEDE